MSQQDVDASEQSAIAPLYWPIERWPRWQQIKYEEGYSAHVSGLTLVDNPHPPQSDNGFMWAYGWVKASIER